MDAVADRPAGRRRVRVRTAHDGRHMVELRVTDTGNGIATHHLPMVFESFYSTKPGGMGLGLSISRSITEAHGGKIAAKNNAHGGATFCVFLPAAGVDEGVRESAPHSTGEAGTLAAAGSPERPT